MNAENKLECPHCKKSFLWKAPEEDSELKKSKTASKTLLTKSTIRIGSDKSVRMPVIKKEVIKKEKIKTKVTTKHAAAPVTAGDDDAAKPDIKDQFTVPGLKVSNKKIKTIKVSRIESDISYRDLLLLFRTAGTVAMFAMDKFRKRNEIIAYVTYGKHSHAERAIKYFHNKKMFGQPIWAEYCDPREFRNLPSNVRDRYLGERFQCNECNELNRDGNICGKCHTPRTYPCNNCRSHVFYLSPICHNCGCVDIHRGRHPHEPLAVVSNEVVMAEE